jgi:lipopolysaccharide biosynthesis glycosyltransferase|tara:strand:- start:1512 stop:2276 length:765 start_codon:yes stop_codon:yes gene_type:complete
MKNIIFIIDAKLNEEGRYSLSRSGPYKYSVKSWKNWASNKDCEVFLLDELPFSNEEMGICWQRYYLFDILEQNEIEYDQVLMVDADTIVHPDCPNFFDMTERKYCGVPCEGSYDWILRSIEIYSKYIFGGTIVPFWKYINGGFQIVNSNHRQFFETMVQLYQAHKENFQTLQKTFFVGTDQTPLNFMLYLENIDVKLFPYEFNMQDMMRKEILDNELTFTKIGWMYHFNAIPNQNDYEKTFDWMQKTYRLLYED